MKRHRSLWLFVILVAMFTVASSSFLGCGYAGDGPENIITSDPPTEGGGGGTTEEG